MILRFLILLNVLCITFSLTYAHTGKRHVEKQNIDIQESNEESASIFLKKLLSFESVEEENLQEPQIFLQKEEVEPEHEEAAALADSLENESNQSNYASETLDSEPQSALAQSESPISKDKLDKIGLDKNIKPFLKGLLIGIVSLSLIMIILLICGAVKFDGINNNIKHLQHLNL